MFVRETQNREYVRLTRHSSSFNLPRLPLALRHLGIKILRYHAWFICQTQRAFLWRVILSWTRVSSRLAWSWPVTGDVLYIYSDW